MTSFSCHKPLFYLLIAKSLQVHVPLPHVFPPSAIRQSPAGRATLGSRTLSDVASLCHSLRWCKKKSQRTRNFVLSSGARRSLPRRRCSSRSVTQQVSACIRTQRISKVRIASHLNCEHSEQYHLPSGKYNFAEQNITAKQYNFAKIKYFCKIKIRLKERILFT